LHGDSLESTAFGEVEFGDIDNARDLFAQARKLYGTESANRMRNGRVDSELAGIALLEGKPAVARGLLPGAIAGLRTRSYKMPPLVAEARLLLACTQSPGAECHGELPANVEHDLAAVAGRNDPYLLWAQLLLAQVDLQNGKPEQARARLTRAIQLSSTELPPAHPRRLEAQLWLAVAAARMGDCAYATAQAQAARRIIEANKLAAHPLFAGANTALQKSFAACHPGDAARMQ